MELTRNEIEVMETLWKAKRSLTGVEIIQYSGDTKSWKDSSVHILINSLLKKNAIKEDGYIRTGKGYARTFSPTESGEAYYTSYLEAIAERINIKSVLAALIDKEKISAGEILELEDMLDKYKKELK